MATMYADLHELVNRLTPEQAGAVRGVVRHMVQASEVNAAEPVGEPEAGGQVRRLSFAGALRSGKGDLAARSEDIIRAEFGDAA